MSPGKKILWLAILSLFATHLYSQNNELIIRQGHRDVINMVRYMPDGQHVMTAGEDKIIKMWDVNTGIDVQSFTGHEAPVKCITITDDGNTMISGDKDGKILIWNIGGDKKPKKIINGHTDAINVITMMPDESGFMSGGSDKLIKHWDFSTFELIKTIEGLTGEVRAIGISPDGTRMVMGAQRSNDVELLLLDAESGVILDDAIKHYKGAGAAKALQYAVLSGVAVATSIGKGDVDKDMMNFYVFDYSNIEFLKDGRSVLISQNLYLPMTAAKDEEDKTGGSMVMIADFNEDRTQFADVKNLQQWNIDYPKTRALLNEDQTKIIANMKSSIKIYDMETAVFPEDRKENPKYEPPLLKEFTGTDIEWLTSIDMSSDYRTVISSSEDRSLDLWDINSGRRIRSLEGYVQPALAVEVLPDGKHIVVGSKGKNMAVWDLTNGQLVRSFDRAYNVNHIDVSKDGKYLVTTATDTRFFKLWNIKSGNIIGTFMEKQEDIVWVKFDEDPEYVLAATESGALKRWSIPDKKIKKTLKEDYKDYMVKYSNGENNVEFEGSNLSVKGESSYTDNQSGTITDAVFSMDGKNLITTNEMGEVIIYNNTAGSKTVSMALIDDYDYITYTPDYYYTSSKGASKAIAYKSEDQIMPFEQMELRFNRPDIVAERLGSAPEKLVLSYKAAYKKRLKRLGFKIEDVESKMHLPQLNIDYRDYPLATTEPTFEYRVNAKDNNYKLNRLNVYINDVPIYGLDGLDISSKDSNTLDQTIDVNLSAGLNEIKTSVVNEKGYESLPQVFEINYEGPYYKPNLYMVSIGVSEYKESDRNLAFAAKDANDMLNVFENDDVFGNVFSQLLTNQKVTRENILELKDFLDLAQIDDVIMIFIAGHGVLSANYDYYFASYDMDFNNPEGAGIAYEDIEMLLANSASRNKLLIMDTCHAGEVDKDEVETIKAQTTERGSQGFRSAGDIVQYKENSFGLSNTLELSKSLFGDLRKGTGATVISAAGGVEFAREGLNSDNGLFTYCFIEGIKTRRADLNRDRKYTVSEFRKYVSQRVTDLSKGQQVPTAREENISNDFRIY
jgi:WD40 repeat protein